MAFKRIIVFFIFTGIFAGVYAAGSQSEVTEEEIQQTLPDAEPMMVVDGDEVYELDDEEIDLMET